MACELQHFWCPKENETAAWSPFGGEGIRLVGQQGVDSNFGALARSLRALNTLHPLAYSWMWTVSMSEISPFVDRGHNGGGVRRARMITSAAGAYLSRAAVVSPKIANRQRAPTLYSPPQALTSSATGPQQ